MNSGHAKVCINTVIPGSLNFGHARVCINTAAVKDPCIIEKIAKEFGSQAVSIAIDIARSEYGDFIISTEFGRNLHNIRAQDWIQEVINRGAGEIIVTSISKDEPNIQINYI